MEEDLREELNGNIIFNIDVMLAKRKMSVGELANRVGITLANMSILKTGKAKAIKVSTLAKLCEALDCQPGDLLAYEREDQKDGR
jgi:putative transcriptional regulator